MPAPEVHLAQGSVTVRPCKQVATNRYCISTMLIYIYRVYTYYILYTLDLAVSMDVEPFGLPSGPQIRARNSSVFSFC